MSKVSDIAQSLVNVATDPCLFEVATQLNELHELESDDGPSTPVQAQLGIGLCYAVKPLKAIVWARKNPWIFGLLAVGSVGGLFALGYKHGKKRSA